MMTRTGGQLLLAMVEAIGKEGSILSFYKTLTEKEAQKLKYFSLNTIKLMDIALARFEEHNQRR